MSKLVVIVLTKMSFRFISFFFLFTLPSFNFCMDVNVGTTLFTQADMHKECWATDNMALLVSRMILEDLMPNANTMVFASDDFVSDLIDYFKLILEIIKTETTGNAKHVTITAWCDVLGGYLHHLVLPISRIAFYSGAISYDTAAMLEELYKELKHFLRTSGDGWTRPDWNLLKDFDIPQQHLHLKSAKDDIAYCRNIMLFEDRQKNTITIPLPFFDSRTRPTAVAIPIVTAPLHNLEAANSSLILMKFFVGAYKCLQAKKPDPESITKFKRAYNEWIETHVMPHLQDEKLYAAFGGILRVRYTLRVMEELHVQTQLVESTGGRAEGKGKTQGQGQGRGEGQEVSQTVQEKKSDKGRMIVTAILITVLVWFFLGLCFICYKMCFSRPPAPSMTTHKSKEMSMQGSYPPSFRRRSNTTHEGPPTSSSQQKTSNTSYPTRETSEPEEEASEPEHKEEEPVEQVQMVTLPAILETTTENSMLAAKFRSSVKRAKVMDTKKLYSKSTSSSITTETTVSDETSSTSTAS